MQFHDFIHRLGLELRLSHLAPDASGACAVQFDDIKVSFYSDPGDAFTALCPLGRVDLDDTAAHESLLRGNLFADGVGGGALAMDDEGGVYLSQRFECGEIDFRQFTTALERFVQVAHFWRGQLLQSRQAEALVAG